MSESIPLFRSLIVPEARDRALAVMSRGWLGYGPECRELETRFSSSREGWALTTGSCTSALYLAALLLREAARPEIIVPAMTFISTAMAFHHAGYTVRVAGVDPDTLMLTAKTVGPLVNHRTRAVVAVHLYGQKCPAMPELRRLCDRSGVSLIEDCAHRLDLLDADAPFGDFACYSFNAVKELPGGEGGMLWGSRSAHEDQARAISNTGLGIDTLQRAASARHADYEFTHESGLKLRGNDLMASLVNGALPSLRESRARRREQFAAYDAALAPLSPRLRPIARGGDDSCLMYVVRVRPEERDAIRLAMAQRMVATSVHYPSLARHPLFADAAYPPVTPFDADDELLTLPTFQSMSPAIQQRVVAALGEALETRAAPTASSDFRSILA